MPILSGFSLLDSRISKLYKITFDIPANPAYTCIILNTRGKKMTKNEQLTTLFNRYKAGLMTQDEYYMAYCRIAGIYHPHNSILG